MSLMHRLSVSSRRALGLGRAKAAARALRRFGGAGERSLGSSSAALARAAPAARSRRSYYGESLEDGAGTAPLVFDKPTAAWTRTASKGIYGESYGEYPDGDDEDAQSQQPFEEASSAWARPAVAQASRRCFSAQPVDESRPRLHPDDALDAFSGALFAELGGASAACTPDESAALLRRLVKSEALRFTDMRDDPKKFFLAHRLLSSLGLSGFGIRFTVQFNLFAGSILGLGGAAQVKRLDDMQSEGGLGCFLLTEERAGVLSGLIVETTADWDAAREVFVLHTPAASAAKNWISQGLVAEYGVVIARLRVNGCDFGPHAFLMQLREKAGGPYVKGVVATDMGTKTVANDLDNAKITFDNVDLPRDALLNRFADISPDGDYVQTTGERMRIEVIGQRLLTGRLAIAQAALVFARALHAKTEAYARGKVCNGLGGPVKLYEMPQLRHCFDESYAALDAVIGFTADVEDRLAACLVGGTIPDAALVEAIAVAKVVAIDVALDRVAKLRLEVGSYALLAGTGFELADMLLTCKFAEGDSRILLQKLARDRLKAVKTGGVSGIAAGLFGSPAETLAAAKLARTLAAAEGKEAQARAWNDNWADVYALADLVCKRHLRQFAEGPRGSQTRFAEDVVDRFQPRYLRAQL
ncbi:hypothetical protein M885DRAFT_508407 [Pelagophyceae sp. CCMP2097]|nr:hypothetical protein M885DRAFT_508407 [Pelagophyceae sp. CCMP2097]|mmetsp:Transcript_6115/g.21763  ORF Transcript_6115/g.21763 Transcript_6115/m.21763 type:complete len:643 (+) Transcript_6115:85-2013(+)